MARRYFNITHDTQPPEPPVIGAAPPGAPPRKAAMAKAQLLRSVGTIRRTDAASAALIALVGVMLALACFLVWSWVGLLAALVIVGSLVLAAPLVPPEATMRLYRAEPMDLRNGLQFYRIADALAARAGLPATPKLYVIPSLTVNAFAAGRPGHAVIALTEGLLRRLDVAETGAVIAHEMSHIRNDDLKIMARADLMARLSQIMWIAAIVLLAAKLPGYLAGYSRMPWLAIGLLFLAPLLGNLVQMAFSRQREFDADLDAVRLTGDPKSVAAALRKVERHQGTLVEDIILPSRRIPVPSLMRTHPPTEARLTRLEKIEAMPQHAPLAVEEAPMVTMVGRGPSSLRPRYRISGLWF